jgi:hypothetical protein
MIKPRKKSGWQRRKGKRNIGQQMRSSTKWQRNISVVGHSTLIT